MEFHLIDSYFALHTLWLSRSCIFNISLYNKGPRVGGKKKKLAVVASSFFFVCLLFAPCNACNRKLRIENYKHFKLDLGKVEV